MDKTHYPELISILVVEEDLSDRTFIQNLSITTERPCRMEFVPTIEQARQILASHVFDLAILVYHHRHGPVIEVVEVFSPVPVILLAERGAEKDVSAALGHGVYEYLLVDGKKQDLSLLPGLIRNALARHTAERSLRESERKYQDLYDNAPDMYFILNHDGTIRSANRMGASRLGYRVDELLGRHVSKVVHPEDWPEVHRHISAMLEDPGRIHNIEFRKCTRDGDILFVSERISIHRDASEDHPSIRIICRDVTAAHEAAHREKELRERLSRSERLETVAVLAGGVAHDLNNILGPVVGYPDLLMEHFVEGSREYLDLQEIQKSAKRAVEVIRDLLTLSRRGKQHMQPSQLNDLVEQYVAAASHRALSARFPDIELTLELQTRLPLIEASPSQFGKLLMNLVMNAFEALHDHGAVTIRTYEEAVPKRRLGFDPIEAGDYVVLEVRDNGPGIPERDRERIFEPFYTRNKYEDSGTGLGLAVVYGVVKDHQGAVDLQSEVGRGTCFRFYFPRSAHQEERSSNESEGVLEGEGRILVVDDVPEQRTIALRFLNKLGYEAEAAENGTHAVRRVEEARKTHHVYDCILMDMIMEDHFDGLDAYRKILEIQPGQRCILVSGYAKTDRVDEALRLGAGQYLRKPFSLKSLGLALCKELGQPSSHGVPDSAEDSSGR